MSDHTHVWKPNGIIEQNEALRSPVSRWDDYLYTAMYSIAVCECGLVKKVKVGEKNGRSRGDDLRAGKER